MLDQWWDYLNLWLRKKFKEVFTTDGSGDTAIRVVGEITTTTTDANTEEIFNLDMTIPNTEYSIVLPTHTTRYTIHGRKNKTIYLAFGPGETTTKFLTIYPGEKYDSDKLYLTSDTTIYVMSSSYNVAEVCLQVKN